MPATSAGTLKVRITICVPPPPPRGSPLAAAGLVRSTTILYIYLAIRISAEETGRREGSREREHGAKQRQRRKEVNRIKEQQEANKETIKDHHRQSAYKGLHPTPHEATAYPLRGHRDN